MGPTVQCECGRELPVRLGQAGTTVSCPCGRTVRVPPLSQLRRNVAGEVEPADAGKDGNSPGSGRPRLTAVGWVFVALAVAALLVAGFAALALDVGPAEGDFFGALLGVGTLLLLGVAAVFLRVFGVRFFRD